MARSLNSFGILVDVGQEVSRRRWSNTKKGFRVGKKVMSAPCNPAEESGCRLGMGEFVLEIKGTGDNERWRKGVEWAGGGNHKCQLEPPVPVWHFPFNLDFIR